MAVFNGSPSNDTLNGTASDDTIRGLGGNDSLSGGDGNDLLLGGEGQDTLRPGAGNDTVDGGLITDRATLTDLNILSYADLTGAGINVNLSGISGDGSIGTGTVLDGTGGTDIVSNVNFIFATDKNDTLVGSNALILEEFRPQGGDDSVNGGVLMPTRFPTNSNRVSYTNAPGAVNIDLKSGLVTGADGNDVLSNIDRVRGSAFADTILGSDNTVIADQLDGLAGNDTIDGRAGFDIVRYDSGGSQGAVVDLALGTATDTFGNTDTLLNIEGATGGDFNDRFIGNAVDNRFLGQDGNDTMLGSAGNDTLNGSDGTDLLSYEGIGIGVNANLATGFAFKSSGTDYLATFENLRGSSADDTLTGGADNNLIEGGSGNDSIQGGAGTDTLIGGTGNDTLDGGAVLDRLTYADANWVSYAGSSGPVSVNLTPSIGGGLSGTGSAQDGLGGSDRLINVQGVIGSASNDTLTGSTLLQEEVFEGGRGNDTIDGGALLDAVLGRDANRVSYRNSATGMTVNLQAGTATGLAGDGNDVLINITGIEGSAFADNFVGSDRSDYVETYFGGKGADTVDGRGGFDLVRYDTAPVGVIVELGSQFGTDGYGTFDTLSNVEGIVGSAFSDQLSGSNTTAFVELFRGLASNDIINGLGGFDRVDYQWSPAAVQVKLEGAARGVANDGYGGVDALFNIEQVAGSAFADTLTGSDGATLETFDGRTGNDTIDGRGGQDQVDYSTVSGNDVVVDLVAGIASNDGFGNTDTLLGIEHVRGARLFSNIITANAGNNSIEGGTKADFLTGGAGNDTLIAGAGNGTDMVEGGAGFDTLLMLAPRAGYSVTTENFGFIRLTNATTQESVSLRGIERIVFTDATWAPGSFFSSVAPSQYADLIAGTSSGDTVNGLEGDDLLNGQAGNDFLIGSGGDDTLNAGTGVDEVSGGSGNDRLDVAAAFASYVVSQPSADVIRLLNPQTGEDVTFYNIETVGFLDGPRSSGSLLGLGGVSTALADSLVGSDSGETLNGLDGNDLIDGQGGDDTLNGGLGDDTLFGGGGRDTASYAGTVLPLDANLLAGLVTLTNQTDTLSGIENLIGSDAEDAIAGDALANWLEGRGGDDLISGGAGDDTIEGGSGADTLSGDLGRDTLSYAGSPAAVTVNLPAASDANGSASDGHGSTDDVLPGTADVLIGSALADSLTGSSVFVTSLGETVGHDDISGGSGNDTLIGLGGNDSLSGDDGNDSLSGGDGDDILKGGAGNDRLDGGLGANLVDYRSAALAVNVNLQAGTASDGLGGSDTLIGITNVLGSPFADSLTGNDADNAFTGFAGNDTINGASGFDGVHYDSATGPITVDLLAQTASGGAEGQDSLISIEAVWASAFNDTLGGNRSDNLLVGAAGNDSLNGSDGNDTLEGGLGNDILRGEAGSDWAAYWGAPAAVEVTLDLASGNGGISAGGAGSDTFIDIDNLSGSDFNDTLTGSTGDNQLDGRAGDDTLNGGDGNDTLMGGLGDDSLTGGTGNDNLGGGLGDDTLRGGTGNDSVSGNEGADQLRADHGNDTLDGGLVLDRASFTDGNTLTFADANAGVTVNLSGITGDGSVGQGTAQDGFGGSDVIRNMPFITGSGYDDAITGSAAMTFEQFEGGSGNDTIDGGAITDPIFGRDSNRAIYSNASFAVVVDLVAGTATGGAGVDTLININQLRGSAYNDTLFGSDATAYVEHFEGRAGNDTIDGRGGSDLARYDNAPAGVVANLGTGVVSDGYGSTDTLINFEGLRGSNFNDWLIGGLAANGTTAIGEPLTDGLERFEGDEGNDTLDGGQGFDRADFTIATTGVLATLGGTAGPGTAKDGQGGTDTLISIEGLRGGRYDDVFTGSDTAAYESFEPRGGNDTVDGKGGIDRIDYFSSELTGAVVDLALGTAQDGFGNSDTLRNIEWARGSVVHDDVLRGNAGANRLDGVGGNDRLEGREGNDSLTGGDGSDTLSGGTGLDVAVFTGNKSGYALSKSSANFNVNGGATNADVLDGVERLRFDDAWVAIDLDGNAGTVAKILGAVFGAPSVANQTYFGIGLFYIDGGMSYEALMQLALDARLGAGASHTAVVTLLYTNVVGVAPDAGALANFVGLLDRHEYTPATLGILAADISLNLDNINLIGLSNTGVDFIPLPGG